MIYACIITQVLHEKLTECCFPNNLAPGDALGAVSYISSREEHVTGDFEALNIRTIGIKNLDVESVMNGRAFPIEVSICVYIVSLLLVAI